MVNPMELWLSRDGKHGLRRLGNSTTLFEVKDPFAVLHAHTLGEPVECYMQRIVDRYKMLPALIDGQGLPDPTQSVDILDFDTKYNVRLLSPARGFKRMTFLALINGQNAYVQFFVRKERNKYRVVCRARTNIHKPEMAPVCNFLGFLIFEH